VKKSLHKKMQKAKEGFRNRQDPSGGGRRTLLIEKGGLSLHHCQEKEKFARREGRTVRKACFRRRGGRKSADKNNEKKRLLAEGRATKKKKGHVPSKAPDARGKNVSGKGSRKGGGKAQLLGKEDALGKGGREKKGGVKLPNQRGENAEGIKPSSNGATSPLKKKNLLRGGECVRKKGGFTGVKGIILSENENPVGGPLGSARIDKRGGGKFVFEGRTISKRKLEKHLENGPLRKNIRRNVL